MESEGRVLRAAVGRLAAGVVVLAAGCGFAVVGVGFLLWALHVRLLQTLTPNAAGAVTGVVALAAGGGLMWAARRLIR